MPTPWQLHRNFMQNGAQSYIWVCSQCQKRNPSQVGSYYIGKDIVEPFLTTEQIESLPVIMPEFYGRCAKCGARGAELHHWGPRALFGKDECEKWPKDYLCKACHDLWHATVTPSLVF